MLKSNEFYRKIKSLNIEPVLKVLDKLEFVNSGGVCAWVTKPGSIAPQELRQLVQSANLGGKPYRLFCRKLGPRHGIPPHVDDHQWMMDRHISRFQIPLVSHPDIKMRWPNDGVELYLEPGYLYEVRVDKTHEVVNNADCERIHIQVDQENATI